jgi:hypothetical protein
MTRCTELVSSVLAEDSAEWHCRSVDEQTVHLVTPRYYADGDAVELLVRTLGDELVVSDGGDTLARLEMSGISLEAGRLREAWRSMLRAHALQYAHGRVLLRGPAEEAPWLLRAMIDALMQLDGLRLLAPSPREAPFADQLVTFLQAEFPKVEPHPELRGRSGSTYRLTAAAGADERLVYVQAIAGNSKQARRAAVEHAFTTFSDVNGTLPKDRKLVVFRGDVESWSPERLRLLAGVAYVGSWEARERVTGFIWGGKPDSPLLLDSDEQLWSQ